MTVTPTGRERTFAPDELIVSKTDPQGRMTYANDVFLRISGYDVDDVIGRPHNLIRHPHMPRAVFRLLWERLGEGREVFAFINNLAQNGDHYWVLAHVTPSYDSQHRLVGYHSNRRCPHRDSIARAAEAYQPLLQEESRHAHPPDAATAALQLWLAQLAAQGMTYDTFVWSLIDLGQEGR
ncbi:hypothetical protein KEM60_02029 [Austwickia sp. TVS 96-490-7B]|uniref:PAS domain-containing protein n=1 Tax=Austwickia sp. TVS 96-490-7B TaxID=2830843 RepID=UPI001C57FCDC|nr:PAS domain-containing protein [Austwickia sp. TVS 96-490-7B]MBW3085818.1 hypothetical protein [Austwickia sp. TVS 96-490-7B]